MYIYEGNGLAASVASQMRRGSTTVAQGLPADSATTLEMSGHRRQKDSLQRICEPDGHPRSDVFRLIDNLL